MIKNDQNKLIFAFLFWGWLVFIIFVSLIPGIPDTTVKVKSGLEIRTDFFIHVAAYFILALLFYYWYIFSNWAKKNFIIGGFLLIGLLFAYLSEIAQMYIPGRSFNIYDFISNGSGIITGTFIPRFFRSIFH